MKRQPIVILLTPSTSSATLGVLPSLFPTLAATGFPQLVISLSPDPTVVREEVRQLLGEGVTGFLCCPTLYPTVADQVAGTKPTLVIWQGAGTALAREVTGRPAPENPVPVPTAETIATPAVVETPITPPVVTPVETVVETPSPPPVVAVPETSIRVVAPVVPGAETAEESKLEAGLEPNLETSLAGEKTTGNSDEIK